MKSLNRKIDKCLEIIINEHLRLCEKKQTLYDEIIEKYPYDIYGLKGEWVFDQKSKQLEHDIELFRHYIHGFYDLIEYIECDIMHDQEKDDVI